MNFTARRLKQIFLGILFVGFVIELLWIWKVDREKADPNASVVTSPSSSQAPAVSAVTTTTLDPNSIVWGVMVKSQADSSVETGIRFALTSAPESAANVTKRVRIVRCVTAPAELAEDCAKIFRDAKARVIVGNPEVDPSSVLDKMIGDGVPYVGAYPSYQSEFIDPNSFQFAPGTQGILFAALRWAIEVKAPSIVLVSTPTTQDEADDFLAAAGPTKIPVDAFDFQTVGTNVKPYLKTANGKKSVVIFLTEGSGCEVVLRGLTRRRPSLAGGMDATFVTNACSEAAVKANLDGLRLMTSRSFANETLSDPQSLAEAAGKATALALLTNLPVAAWDTSVGLHDALTNAAQPTPVATLGAWACAARRIEEGSALCGQQTQIVGLGSDTKGIAVWIDALRLQ